MLSGLVVDRWVEHWHQALGLSPLSNSPQLQLIDPVQIDPPSSLGPMEMFWFAKVPVLTLRHL